MILYEDLDAGKRAMHALCGLSSDLAGSIGFHPQLWRFDFLEDSNWRALASTDVVNADVIVISWRGQRLPAWFQAWFYACLSHRSDRPGAVVALIGQRTVQQPPAQELLLWLQHAAREVGMEFFSSPADERQRAAQDLDEPDRSVRTKTRAAGLHDFGDAYDIGANRDNPPPFLGESLSLEGGYRHWGINE